MIDRESIRDFTDKDSKVDKYLELYERHDFLTAYSKHTDLRMQADPHWAIGRGDEWESHGLLQLSFLKEQGLKPYHKLLDVGCGPGRGARRFVPYLDTHNYVGVDISRECLIYAEHLSLTEGWIDRQPKFLLNGDLQMTDGQNFDFIWAHSVFTHLPEDQIDTMIRNAAQMLSEGGRFLFTFKRWNAAQRTGLKQFRYPPQTFDRISRSYGMKFQQLPMVWPASQRTGMIARPD